MDMEEISETAEMKMEMEMEPRDRYDTWYMQNLNESTLTPIKPIEPAPSPNLRPISCTSTRYLIIGFYEGTLGSYDVHANQEAMRSWISVPWKLGLGYSAIISLSVNLYSTPYCSVLYFLHSSSSEMRSGHASQGCFSLFRIEKTKTKTKTKTKKKRKKNKWSDGRQAGDLESRQTRRKRMDEEYHEAWVASWTSIHM